MATTSTGKKKGTPKPIKSAKPAKIAGNLKVRAINIGYYNHARRREGDVFQIASTQDFSSKWMEYVDGHEPETAPTGAQAAINKAHDAELKGRAVAQAANRGKGKSTGDADVLGD